MNNENVLYKNKYIQKVSSHNIPSDKKQQFRKFYEDKNNVNEVKSQDTSPPSNRIFQKKTIVNIDSKFRDINIYPKQNDFKSFIGKTFYNVNSIRLISTEIPNTDQAIKEEPPELQNNIMYWQNQEDVELNYYTGISIEPNVVDKIDLTIVNHNIDTPTRDITIYNSKLITDSDITGFMDRQYRATVVDENTLRVDYKGSIPVSGTVSVDIGAPIYSVEFKPGNYTAFTLAEQMQTSFNTVKRRNGNGQFHYFEVTVNLDTDVMLFDSVITTQLGSSPISTTAASGIITVNSISHGFKTGDRVKMINVKNTSGISASVLSGDHVVNVLDSNTFTYEVNTRAIDTTDGGGNTVLTGKDAPFRFLLDSQNTLLQYNIGFPDEDSSEAISATSPITTKVLNVSDISIVGDYLRIITTEDHELTQSNKIIISNISTGYPMEITTSTEHGIEIPSRVTLRNTNSSPNIDGTYFVTPTSVFTFTITTRQINISGNYGEVLYNGDMITLSGLKSVPRLESFTEFFVENVVLPNQFEIYFFVTSIDVPSIQNCVIGTSQVFVNHPQHGFNRITTILDSASGFANISTFLPHDFIGSYTENVTVIDGPVGTNTVDINLVSHGLSTSDLVTITDSTSDPVIDGVYRIQVVTVDYIRVNFVHASFIPGTVSISTGDKINIHETNSTPKIDGYFYISNRRLISAISTGTVVVNLSIQGHSWKVGDSVTVSGTNSTPPIDGAHIIQSVIDADTISIETVTNVVSPGTSGIIINHNSALIKTGLDIVSPGTHGIVGRTHSVTLYRIEAETETGDNLGGINLNALNGIERVITKLIDADNYMIRCENSYATKNITLGGSLVRASSSIHGRRSIQANTDTGNSTGKLFRSITLEGENYLFLTSPGLDTILTNSSTVTDIFAKLLLNEAPGLMIFNSFVSAPKEFDHPIAKFDEVHFKVVDRDGYPFNFNDINYSVSLEITEVIEQPDDTWVSSRTGKSRITSDFLKPTDTRRKELQSNIKSTTSEISSGGRFGTTRSSRNR